LPTIIGYYFSIFEIGTFPLQRKALNTPPNELCPALVSLVFLHTFFGLAHFCKKQCNPVFNVLGFFKTNEERSLLMIFIATVLGTCFALQALIWNPQTPLQEM
jgi:hypothetical protein